MSTTVDGMTLTAKDRCDRCGAQAYMRVEISEDQVLLFCAHHAREHGPVLKEKGYAVQDETHRLASAAST